MQGNIHVSSIFGSEGCSQLKGPEIASELRHLLTLLTLCWHFSKKPFPLFLEETGYSEESVLLQEPKAGVSYHLNTFSFVVINEYFILGFCLIKI